MSNFICRKCGGTEGKVPLRRVCFACLRKYTKNWRQENIERVTTKNQEYYRTHKQEWRDYERSHLWERTRNGAKQRGRVFTLTKQEFEPYCAVVSCEFCGVEFDSDNAKSIDRIDNAKGYEPGNIACLCVACNRMKSNHTPTSLRQWADWIDSKLKAQS